MAGAFPADAIKTLRSSPFFARHVEFLESHDDMGLGMITGEIAQAFVKAGEFERNPTGMITGVLSDPSAAAALTAFPDGSGLAVLSDTLIGIVALTGYVNVWLMPRRTRHWLHPNRHLSSVPGATRADARAAVAALRYYFMQCRLFLDAPHKPTLVLPEVAAKRAEIFNGYALEFVVAHEMAHFVLGHGDAREVSPAQLHQNEHAADRLAFEVLKRVRLPSRDGGLAAWAQRVSLSRLLYAGVRNALAALEAVEHALFVRLPVTHPPAAERWAHLMTGEQRTLIRDAETWSRGSRLSLASARTLSEPLPDHSWRAYAEHPYFSLLSDDPSLTHADVVGKLLYGTAFYDQMHGMSREQTERALHEWTADKIPELVPAVELIISNELSSALALFEVAGARRAAILDGFTGLTFFSLQDSFHASPRLEGLDKPDRLIMAVLIALVLAAHGLEPAA